MKGTFKIDRLKEKGSENLFKLKEIIENKEPYAVIVVSTTGLDSTDFKQHSPTRVVLKQFEYDKETESYQESIAFDELVKAPDEAVKAALNNEGYDAFANGDIDKDSYINGENVLTPEEFKEKFDRMITAISEDNTTLIINGTLRFATHYLDKINCGDSVKKLSNDGKLLEQTALTKEYFNEVYSEHPEFAPKNSLEQLRYTVLSTNPVMTRAAGTCSAEDFKDIFPNGDYTRLKKEHDRITGGAIIGGDKRIDVISSFVTAYGIKENLLPPKALQQQIQMEAEYNEDLSLKGQKKYRSGNLEQKFNTLIETGKINPDEILNGKSEYQKLIDTVSDKSNKGLIFIHAASTGFEFKKSVPQNTGFPIQFTAVVYSRDKDGNVSFKQTPKGMKLTIQAPAKSLELAIKNITDSKRPYDTFAESGIDLEQYQKGIGVISSEEAAKNINSFFSKYSPKDYAIVAIGGTSGTTQSFTQTCISNLGNFAVNNAPYVDIAQVIKDYSYLAAYNDDYPENTLFDAEKIEGKSFGIQDIAGARGETTPKTPSEKCKFAANITSLLLRQYMEIYKPEEIERLNEADRKAVEAQQEKERAKTMPRTAEATAPVEPEENERKDTSKEITEQSAEQKTNDFWNHDYEKDENNDEDFVDRSENTESLDDNSLPQKSDRSNHRVDDRRPAPQRRVVWRDVPPKPETSRVRFNESERSFSPYSPEYGRYPTETHYPTENIALADVVKVLSETIANLNEAIANRDETIAKRDETIAKLNEQVLDVTKKYMNLMEEIIFSGDKSATRGVPYANKQQ